MINENLQSQAPSIPYTLNVDAEKSLLLSHYENNPFHKDALIEAFEEIIISIQTILLACANYPQRIAQLTHHMLKFNPQEYQQKVYPAILDAYTQDTPMEQLKVRALADSLLQLCRFVKQDEGFLQATYGHHVEKISNLYKNLPLSEKKHLFSNIMVETTTALFKKYIFHTVS